MAVDGTLSKCHVTVSFTVFSTHALIKRAPNAPVSAISLLCPIQWFPALRTSLDTVLPYLQVERKVLFVARRCSPGAFKAVGPHLEKG